MDIETRQQRDIVVVDMVGRLDGLGAGNAHDKLVAIAKGGATKVVLNLDRLVFVSSAGLRVILTLARLLQSGRGEMRICSPSAAVREVLTTSGFNSLIHIFDDEKSAVESLS